MVLNMATIWYPHDKGSEVAAKYIEVFKKYPPDPSISEAIALGVTSDKDGLKTIAISNIKKGKFKEALTRAYQFQIDMASGIDGYRYKIETLMDITEAMGTVGMKPPE